MSPPTTTNTVPARRVLLTGGAIAGGTPEKLLALAWMSLGRPRAPQFAQLPERVTVLPPFCVEGE